MSTTRTLVSSDVEERCEEVRSSLERAPGACPRLVTRLASPLQASATSHACSSAADAANPAPVHEGMGRHRSSSLLREVSDTRTPCPHSTGRRPSAVGLEGWMAVSVESASSHTPTFQLADPDLASSMVDTARRSMRLYFAMQSLSLALFAPGVKAWRPDTRSTAGAYAPCSESSDRNAALEPCGALCALERSGLSRSSRTGEA